MQKLDFLKNLGIILDKLKSKQIISHFEGGFVEPSKQYNYGVITPLLFLSKSNYDQIKTDEKYSGILEGLNASEIYQEQNLASLSILLRNNPAASIFTSNSIKLFNFHKALIQLERVATNIFRKEAAININNYEDGKMVFQIVIDEDGLATEKYIKIFTTLEELIKTLSKLFGEEEQRSEIILLDSGSDTNLGIKAGVETTKSLFLIFKEVWGLLTNYRLTKEKNKQDALINSLTVRGEILAKVKEGVISEEEAKEYTHIIKTRTDELIGLKVLPKQIVQEINQIENKKLLEELQGIKLLGAGD